jgi:hypothetical protein
MFACGEVKVNFRRGGNFSINLFALGEVFQRVRTGNFAPA